VPPQVVLSASGLAIFPAGLCAADIARSVGGRDGGLCVFAAASFAAAPTSSLASCAVSLFCARGRRFSPSHWGPLPYRSPPSCSGDAERPALASFLRSSPPSASRPVRGVRPRAGCLAFLPLFVFRPPLPAWTRLLMALCLAGSSLAAAWLAPSLGPRRWRVRWGCPSPPEFACGPGRLSILSLPRWLGPPGLGVRSCPPVSLPRCAASSAPGPATRTSSFVSWPLPRWPCSPRPSDLALPFCVCVCPISLRFAGLGARLAPARAPRVAASAPPVLLRWRPSPHPSVHAAGAFCGLGALAAAAVIFTQCLSLFCRSRLGWPFRGRGAGSGSRWVAPPPAPRLVPLWPGGSVPRTVAWRHPAVPFPPRPSAPWSSAPRRFPVRCEVSLLFAHSGWPPQSRGFWSRRVSLPLLFFLPIRRRFVTCSPRTVLCAGCSTSRW